MNRVKTRMNVLKVAINFIHVYNKINGLFGNYDNITFVNKKEFSWRNKQGGHINFVQLCLQTD